MQPPEQVDEHDPVQPEQAPVQVEEQAPVQLVQPPVQLPVQVDVHAPVQSLAHAAVQVPVQDVEQPPVQLPVQVDEQPLPHPPLQPPVQSLAHVAVQAPVQPVEQPPVQLPVQVVLQLPVHESLQRLHPTRPKPITANDVITRPADFLRNCRLSIGSELENAFISAISLVSNVCSKGVRASDSGSSSPFFVSIDFVPRTQHPERRQFAGYKDQAPHLVL